jgi:hypothetical protein
MQNATTIITASPLSGFASANQSDPQTARFFRITFPEKGKPVLNIGPGDHTCQRWHLSMDDLKALVRDALPELLR